MDEMYIKKYKTWIKGSIGTLALLLFMNLVYIVFVLIKKKPDFWFNLEISEFCMKSTSLFEGYSGSLPIAVGVAGAVFFGIIGIVICALSSKNTKFILLCLIYTLLDTALLVFVNVSNYFGDVSENCWISIICHLFMVLFLISGVIGHKKLSSIGVKYDGVI